jgi:hypothetical protein
VPGDLWDIQGMARRQIAGRISAELDDRRGHNITSGGDATREYSALCAD